MNHALNRAILAASVLVMIVSVPVVGAFMTGIDRPPRTDLAIYDASVDSEDGQHVLRGTLYLLDAEDVVVEGVRIDVVGRSGRLLATERIGDVRGTTKRPVAIALPSDEVAAVRIRVDAVVGASDLRVEGLQFGPGDAVSTYVEPFHEYRY